MTTANPSKSDRGEHGYFAKGNKIGRMKKKGYTIKDLTNTALAYNKTHDVTILKHYIEELMNDNTLLKDFINKYVPTTTKQELTGADGGPITYKEIIYDPKKEEECQK